MIKVIKKGNNIIKKEIFTTTCDICGCEFEFEEKDCKETLRGYCGMAEKIYKVIIVCPCCHKGLERETKELKTRTEEEELI